METRMGKIYSDALGREMEYIRYGSSGKPFFAVPSQDGRYFDFANFGMVDAVADYIEQGRIQIISFDTIDRETWSNEGGDPAARMQLHEKWYHYVCDELYPHVMAETGYSGRAGITGCSMGAYHAANFFFRRPDLFDTVIALSGVYDPALLIHGYFDATMYMNSPVHSLRNMPADHPYMELFRHSKIIICVGQGAWEELMQIGTRELDEVLAQKGIPAWIDYWGYDVNHDWPWWRKQWRYFLERTMEG